MKTFNDSNGRTWMVTINVDAIKRVKSLLTVNLLDAIEGNLLERLVAYPVLLCDILYALCKPQADSVENAVQWRWFVRSAKKDLSWGPRLASDANQ